MLLAGTVIILVSVFAFQLGIDNNPIWGMGRFCALIFGVGISLFGASGWFMPALNKKMENVFAILAKDTFFQGVGRSKRQLRGQIQIFFQSIRNVPLIVRIRTSKLYGWLYSNRSDIWLILLSCCLIWIYVWIISIGRIGKWPSGKDYYWMLSQAFRQGQTHLLVEPNPELVTLENPYDYHQRKGLAYLWDASLYDGKYYLYWGPVPAVLGVIVSSITSSPVTDAGLVFVFVIGTALFSLLLLRDVYIKYQLPPWVFWGGVLASTVNVPLIWLLTRPKFYEVSISGGQFFLMMGFWTLFRGFSSSLLRKRYVAFSAIAFGLAGATRINLLPSVLFLAVVIFWRIYALHQRKIRQSMPAFMSAFLPFALIACSLFWYNYVRFGSIFEFGHRYQLTGPALSADYENINSIKYIIPNLYTYVFRPPSLNHEFPFFTISWVTKRMWPFFIHLPEHYYYTEPVAGILFVVPLVGIAVLLLIRLLWLFVNGDISLYGNKAGSDTGLPSWLWLAISGYVVIQMSVLLLFINSAVRYLLDVSPALILLSTIFIAYYVRSVERRSYQRIISFVWIAASLLTVLSGLLIGITGDRNNFLNQNPQLYNQLFEWFSR
jgi:hypothetical protein